VKVEVAVVVFIIVIEWVGSAVDVPKAVARLISVYDRWVGAAPHQPITWDLYVQRVGVGATNEIAI
jgi:hypothetical protein